MLSVITLSVVMLIVVMVIVITLNNVILIVVIPKFRYTECPYAEIHFAKSYAEYC